MTEARKTKVPIDRIRTLIRLKKKLDDEVKLIMEEYKVDINYIRGLFKLPTDTPPTTRSRKRTPKKKTFDRTDLIE